MTRAELIAHIRRVSNEPVQGYCLDGPSRTGGSTPSWRRAHLPQRTARGGRGPVRRRSAMVGVGGTRPGVHPGDRTMKGAYR